VALVLDSHCWCRSVAISAIISARLVDSAIFGPPGIGDSQDARRFWEHGRKVVNYKFDFKPTLRPCQCPGIKHCRNQGGSLADPNRAAELPSFMDYGFISEKIARLRADLDQIRADNRLYFANNHHTEYEMMQHQKRRERIVEIKIELEAMMKRKTA
jgi:hypothetical protein